jgi:hypothetical protein
MHHQHGAKTRRMQLRYSKVRLNSLESAERVARYRRPDDAPALAGAVNGEEHNKDSRAAGWSRHGLGVVELWLSGPSRRQQT